MSAQCRLMSRLFGRNGIVTLLLMLGTHCPMCYRTRPDLTRRGSPGPRPNLADTGWRVAKLGRIWPVDARKLIPEFCSGGSTPSVCKLVRRRAGIERMPYRNAMLRTSGAERSGGFFGVVALRPSQLPKSVLCVGRGGRRGGGETQHKHTLGSLGLRYDS